MGMPKTLVIYKLVAVFYVGYTSGYTERGTSLLS